MSVASWLEQRAIYRQNPEVSAAPAGHRVDRERLMADVGELSSSSYEGRRTGSAGSHIARDYICRRFEDAGVAGIAALAGSSQPASSAQPAGSPHSAGTTHLDSATRPGNTTRPGNITEDAAPYLEPFIFVHRSIRGLFTPGRKFRTGYPDAANLIGTIPGTDPSAPYLVISAHYDHLGIMNAKMYPGADDNASGIAVLLAAARWVSQHPLIHPMLFAAFDGEEEGLRGSEAFIRNPTFRSNGSGSTSISTW